VLARHVEVEVVGTEFDVDVLEDRVRVAVLRGRVRVGDGTREVDLAAGDALELAIAAAHAATAPAPVAPPIEYAPAEAVASPAAREPTIEELEARADRARIARRPDEAAALLERLVREAPSGDERVGAALFTLATIRAAQGRHEAAARHYARCRALFPRGTLAEDALAGEAVEAGAAGDGARASRLAAEYAERYPRGPHLAPMQRLARPGP
jgi:hypothetical protein